MKATRFIGALAYPLILCLFSLVAPVAAQQPTLGIQMLTNREVLLRLTAPNTAPVRIDAADRLPDWKPFLTLQSTGVNQHLDTATPYLNSRFYRAEQLTGTNLSGDHIMTTNGDIVIHPMYHATLVVTWNGRTIYNDPDTINAYPTIYNGLPKADLILISHDHSDHFDSARINAVTNTGTIIVVPGYVYSNNNFSVAQRAMAAVLRYGDTTNLFGIGIQAVPATNGNHLPNRGNGYVITLADKRLYFSGDTGAITPLRTLPNIDVAFVAMNEQFTMSVTAAADLVRAFRPKIVYPYHYQNNPPADLNLFKRLVGTDLGIEVRFRKWY